jgi:TetR/AcrR family transcriptional regulator, regulator of cefoperazone and chloramphenicol sensitivity
VRSQESDTRRPYRSQLREQQAAQTRAAVIEAARAMFAEHGWSSTSVRSIAEAAGVSEATVYATYRSKAGLALALVDAADAAAGVERAVAELAAGHGHPEAQLQALVGFDRRLFDDGGSLIAVVVEGRRDSPELDAAYRSGRARGDAIRRDVFSTWPQQAWREGVDVDHALDAYAALCSFQTFVTLRDERGWSADRIERWWWETLRRVLLAAERQR